MKNIDIDDINSKNWFNLLVDGCFKFYRSYEFLENHINLLKNEGFDLYCFDCNEWNDEICFEKDFALKTNIKNKQFKLPEGNGYIILLKNFEDYFLKDFDKSFLTLNFINRLSWIYLLFGKKLIVFLNSNGNSVNEFFNNINNSEFIGIKSIRWIDGDAPEIKLK